MILNLRLLQSIKLYDFYGNQEDEKLLSYVNQVGSYVAGFSDAPERRYMFEIINSDMVNAFAAPVVIF
jgi:predicted Zn-dependent protease